MFCLNTCIWELCGEAIYVVQCSRTIRCMQLSVCIFLYCCTFFEFLKDCRTFDFVLLKLALAAWRRWGCMQVFVFFCMMRWAYKHIWLLYQREFWNYAGWTEGFENLKFCVCLDCCRRQFLNRFIQERCAFCLVTFYLSLF